MTGPAGAVNNDIAVFNGVTGKIIKDGGQTIAQVIAAAIAGSGDVVGPAGATDNAVVRFDGATGKLIQNSLAILSDSGSLVLPDLLDAQLQARISAVNGPVGPIGNPIFPLSLQNNSGGCYLEILNNTGAGKGMFIGLDTTSVKIINFQGGNIQFFTEQAASLATLRMQIDNRGFVCIGQSGPSYGLDVIHDSAPANMTMRVIDNIASTGSTGIFFNAGAAQSNNPILTVQGSNSIQAAGTVKGVLTTLANATTGLAAGVLAALTNATIVITDGTGQVYRIPCII